MTYRPGALAVQISDDGAPIPPRTLDRTSGHGLVGIRERALLFGGTLHAGPGPFRGWQVTADLPLDTTAPGTTAPDTGTVLAADTEQVASA